LENYKDKLILVKLNNEQIENAKLANGKNKRITHALICSDIGQIFGTELYCTKYYEAWRRLYPGIFKEAFRTNDLNIRNYSSTHNLVVSIIEYENFTEKNYNSEMLKDKKPSLIDPKLFIISIIVVFILMKLSQ